MVAALIDKDGMAVLFQQGALGVKDGILPPGQPVAGVDEQNAPGGGL